jgi:hypothetical protein
MLHELARLLAMTPARVIGFVATAVPKEADYGYGYGYGYAASAGKQPESVKAEVGDVA